MVIKDNEDENPFKKFHPSPEKSQSLLGRNLKLRQDQQTFKSAEKAMREEMKNGALLRQMPLFIRIFFSEDDRRAKGRRFAISNKVMIKAPQGNVTGFYSIVLFNQVMFGAIGGLVAGFDTKLFAMDRLPIPNTPLPVGTNQRIINGMAKTIARSSSLYRMGKRGVLAGILFDLADKNFSEIRGREDWANSSMAGLLCGLVFGLRGGFQTTLINTGFFSLFGAVVGYMQTFKRKNIS